MRLLAHIWMVQETETGQEVGKAIKSQSPPADRSTSSSKASLPTGATTSPNSTTTRRQSVQSHTSVCETLPIKTQSNTNVNMWFGNTTNETMLKQSIQDIGEVDASLKQ